MSYQTTANEKVDEAKDNVRDAIKSLSEIVINQCYGHDEFSEEYQQTLAEVMAELINIRKRL